MSDSNSKKRGVRVAWSLAAGLLLIGAAQVLRPQQQQQASQAGGWAECGLCVMPRRDGGQQHA